MTTTSSTRGTQQYRPQAILFYMGDNYTTLLVAMHQSRHYLVFALIRLHSVLHTYRETFRDSIDVSKTFRLRCDLCYKPHFALFSCNFLTNGLTHWSRVRNYQLNDYVSQESESTHSSTSITCVQKLCTFATLHLFVTFARFYDFNQTVHQKLVPDITNIGSVT